MIHFQTARPVASILAPQVQERLRRAVRIVLEECGVDTQADLSLVLTTDKEIHVLNRQYRKVDAPTDVLSFPSDETDPQSGVRYLGDLIISVERAQLNVENSQSEYQMTSLEDELVLLTVHGTLHLLGHDHAEPEEKARMWASQEIILTKLGILS